MSVRFRYLAPDGREVEVATTDELVRAFMSGSLQNDSLLYDAEGGGWAPARNQSALLGIDLPSMTLTLAESAAQGAEELLEQFRREGGDSPDHVPTLEGMTGPKVPVHLREETEAPPSTRASASQETVLSRRSEAPRLVPVPALRPSPSALHAGVAPAAQSGGEPLRKPPRPRRAVAALGAVTTALAGLAVVLFLFVLLGDANVRGAGATPVRAEVRDVHAASALVALPAALPEAVARAEAEALFDMLVEMEQLQQPHQVTRVPSAWLEGIYLAEAGRFPEVRGYWERYAAYIEEMRLQEGELFRRSLVRRLQQSGLSESALSMRVARGLRAFQADRPRRETVYASLAELSASAIDLHDLLVEHQHDISYEPAREGISRDPVTEAVPETRGLAAEMNRRLDRLFLAIERTEGSRIAPREELPTALRRGLASGQEPPSD